MSVDIVSSEPSFRNRIIAVLIDTDWMLRYGAIIKPEFFPMDAEQALVEWINQYYQDYGDAPDCVELRNGLDGEEDVLDLLDDVEQCIESLTDRELIHAADVTLDFTQVQAMKIAVLKSAESIRDGDLRMPLRLVHEAQQIGQDYLDLGMELVDDAESWVYEELHGKRFPTGIPRLDTLLGGGLSGGEYGLIMAPPGMGKSTLLVNIAYGMAGLLGTINVLVLTYEMSAQKYLKRFGARLVGTMLRRGDGSEGAYIKSLRRQAKAKLRGRLRVMAPSDYTIDGIRRVIDSLAGEGFDTEALVVDYPDLMHPLRKRKELRFELADIARGLRELGNEYDVPVWGGTQAGRQAIYKEIIHIGDIAEAIEKAAIADVVISVCQTKEEEKLGHGRLYLAKVRDAADKFIIPVKLDFERQTITIRKTLDVKLGR